jgi:hypothetical protein
MATTDAVQFTGQIAALQGAPGGAIQTILSQFAEALKRDGFRVAGVVEISQCGDEGACKRLAVRDLTSKAVIKFSQDLGAGSTACNLDPSGLAKACEAVERAIEDGGRRLHVPHREHGDFSSETQGEHERAIFHDRHDRVVEVWVHHSACPSCQSAALRAGSRDHRDRGDGKNACNSTARPRLYGSIQP